MLLGINVGLLVSLVAIPSRRIPSTTSRNLIQVIPRQTPILPPSPLLKSPVIPILMLHHPLPIATLHPVPLQHQPQRIRNHHPMMSVMMDPRRMIVVMVLVHLVMMSTRILRLAKSRHGRRRVPIRAVDTTEPRAGGIRALVMLVMVPLVLMVAVMGWLKVKRRGRGRIQQHVARGAVAVAVGVLGRVLQDVRLGGEQTHLHARGLHVGEVEHLRLLLGGLVVVLLLVEDGKHELLFLDAGRGRHHGHGGFVAEGLGGFGVVRLLLDAACWGLGLVVGLALGVGGAVGGACGGVALFLGILGDAIAALVRAVSARGLDAQHGGAESGVAHAGGVAVGDLLGEDGVVGDLVPVNLDGVWSVGGFWSGGHPELTSFRHFCWRMAKRNLVMALSLAAMIATGLGSTTGLLDGVGGRVESQPTTDLAGEGRGRRAGRYEAKLHIK